MYDKTTQHRMPPMAGKVAGKDAGRAITGALRSAEAAQTALTGAPRNDHTRDGLAALGRALKDLREAEACAAALRKGVKG